MIYTTQNDILFDDITLLENTLGVGALKVTAVNANCDCVNTPSNLTHQNADTNQITQSASAPA